MKKYLKHENFNKDFKDGIYKNGVETLNLYTWEKFHRVVKIFNGYEYYIWRGQRKEWKLKSTFDRYNKFSKEKDRKKELDKILDNFKKRLKNLPNTNNINFKKENEIWAIGQHYNLKTPLLDWTEIPYFAAYFAFYKKNDKNETEDRVVYALNRDLGRSLLKLKDPKTKEVLSIVRKIEFVMSHFAPEHHQRLINQKGAFTRAYKGDDIKSILQDFWEGNYKKNKFTTEVILAEILIPNKFCDECLSSLKSMNITHGTLFPDYAGAVEICKIDLGLDNLK